MKKNILMGQRFLRSKKVREQIIGAADLSKKDTILEVGPGDGFLTEALVERAGRVIAVEKDRRFVEALREKFCDTKNIEIIEGDILEYLKAKYKISSYSKKFYTSSLDRFKLDRFKIVANIPYYLTSRFLRAIFSVAQKPQLMVLMVQKEVADRIVAKHARRQGGPPQMNLLALSVQAYGNVKRIANVRKGAFSPPPRVDSAIIKIFDISDDFFEKNHIAPEQLFALARRAFAQKRKMLSNSLGLKGDTRRPQELSLEDWAKFFGEDAYKFPS